MRKNFGTAIVLFMLFLSSTIGVVDGANLIANPGFESGTTSWIFYASGGGTFTTPSPGYEGNKSALLVLSNAGTNIQLYQTPVALEANTRYRLSFAAYSNTGHDMTVRLSKHVSPFTAYMPEFTVNLGTTWQTFSNEFNSTGFSGTVNDGRLMFWLPQFGAKGDNYYIDDVRLEKVTVQNPIQINSCTRISSPGEYVLTQNIINSGVTSCINITSSDVILDGAGYTVDGNGLTNYGLSANNVNRVIVKNLIVQDWNTRAVNIVNSNNNNFSNITVKSGNYDGFSLQNSNNNILRDIKALNTGNVGFVFENSYGNDLKDSVFQNNSWEDFDIYLTGGVSGCNNEVGNVSLTKHQLYYYNKSVNLKDIYAGAIYLCNADNSIVTNATVAANGQNSISNYYVENVTYTNIVTSGLREAMFFKYSANNNITNILMKDGWSGISYSTNTTNTNFKNATIYNMTDRAIRMYAGASGNSISDSKIYDNSVGIYLNTAGKYGPNKIYNSYFNNTQNIEWGISDFFGDGSVYPNSWNTTKQPGINIIGGPSLGGNFWGYPNGTGFSQTCLDGNNDGICDSAYTLKSNNIDYLPLAYNAAEGSVHNINKSTNYATIQAAINDASAGDEIRVDSGTYYENVNVNKRLILRGIGMPVVDAGSSGSAITLTADGIILEGFAATEAVDSGIKVNSKNNIIRGNNASNNGKDSSLPVVSLGISLSSSSNNTLRGNNANNNTYCGICLSSSSNNILNDNNVSNNGEGIVLNFSSNNNILNGNNASINYHGISLSSSSNNTLRGNNANNNTYCGICLYTSSNNILNDNNVSNNGEGMGIILDLSSNNNILNGNNASINYHGIYLYSSSNNKLNGNNANMNRESGIYLNDNNDYNTLSGNNISNNLYGIILEFSNNNEIYNNIFNNSNNIQFYGSNIDTWNIARQSGINIVGGPFLGGNFWALPNGTGFSQTCTDADGDGICDSAYVIDSNNIDYLPLALPPIPSITVGSPDGGENWTQGSTQEIRWNYTGSPGSNVRIELLRNGLPDSMINSSTPTGSSGSGSYSWIINSSPATDYKVRITSTTNSTYTDTSNSNFTISPASNTTRPTVIGSTPTGTNVPVSTQINITFSEAMNQSSAQTAFSTVPTTTGSFTWSGNMMIYTASPALNAGATYTITVGTGAKDLAGNALVSAFSWQFTTITTNPGDGVPSGYLILGTTKVSPPGYTYTGDLIVSSIDSSEGRWTTKAPMPTARYGFAAAVVNNKIYAIGGYTDQGLITNLNEEYDPASNSWTTKTPMTVARDPAVVVVNNKIYAIGGGTNQEYSNTHSNLNEEYDPASNSWTTKTPMTVARDPAVVVVNNKIYAIGGWTNQGPSNLNEEYDPASNLWTTKIPIPTAQIDLQVAVVNNKIYAIGPDGFGLMYSIVNEEYDPASNSWTSKAPLRTEGIGFAVAVANNKIYAIGGHYDGPTVIYHQNEEYDPSSNLWTTKAPMPTARFGLYAVAANNKIYAIGGLIRSEDFPVSNPFNSTNVNEEYDPVSDSWTTKAPMTAQNPAVVIVNNKIYAIGGYTDQEIVTNLNEEFSINNIYYIHLKN